jgi:predicted dehydrogenase
VSATTPIVVALLGYGYAGKTFHAPLVAAVRGLRLGAVVSHDAAKVRADWPDVLVTDVLDQVLARPDIDLVVIATPNDTHADLARRALLAGKHVVVDKPVTATVAEAEDLQALALAKDRVLSVFHNRRWDADFLTVRRLITAGELGDVVDFESRFDRYRPAVRSRWREQPGSGTGLWYDLGPHLVDQALQLFGSPLAVYADVASQRLDAQAVDYFHVLLRYERLRVVLHGSLLAPGGSLRFAVHGSRASYVKHDSDPQEDALKRGERPREPGWGRDLRDGEILRPSANGATSERVATLPGNYLAFYAGVRDAIAVGAPNPVPPADAVATMRVLERACESAAAGRELPT